MNDDKKEILDLFKNFGEDCISAVNNFIIEQEVGAEEMVLLIARHYSDSPNSVSSIDDNIFKIGIDSLSLLQVVFVLEQAMKEGIDLEEIQSWQTLQDIANFLNEKIFHANYETLFGNCGLEKMDFTTT